MLLHWMIFSHPLGQDCSLSAVKSAVRHYVTVLLECSPFFLNHPMTRQTHVSATSEGHGILHPSCSWRAWTIIAIL